MRRVALVLPLVLLLAGSWTVLPAAAQAPAERAIDPNTGCATGFEATRIDGDPSAVVVRIIDPVAPPAGTITAYGADTMWSGTIERSALTENRYGVREASVTVRADAPIEGIVYAPAWAPCTFHTGVRSRVRYDPEVQRPVLTLTKPAPVVPAVCARPYLPPTVLKAIEPDTPLIAMQQRIGGTVRIAVALDEQGVPRFSRVVSSPDKVLNSPSVSSAMHSTYSAAVFRCKPVPSGYEFAVDFSTN
jgi:hypothetical protein